MNTPTGATTFAQKPTPMIVTLDDDTETLDLNSKKDWSSSSEEIATMKNNSNRENTSTSPRDEEGSPPPSHDVFRSDSSGSDDSEGDGSKEDEDSDSRKRKAQLPRPQRKLRKGEDGAIGLRTSTRETRRASTDSQSNSGSFQPAMTPIVPGSNPFNIVLTPESMLSKDVSDLPSGWSTIVKPRKKTGGRKDLYFVSPDGRCYRSKKQVYQLLGVPLEMIQNTAKMLSDAKGKANIPKSLQNTLNPPKAIEKPLPSNIASEGTRRMLRSMKPDETEFAELHMFKNDSRYSIQIGDEYQAKLPEYTPNVDKGTKSGELVWDPSKVSADELDKYLDTVRMWNSDDLSKRPSAFSKSKFFEGKTRKCTRWSYSEERALNCLHNNNYEVKAALKTIQTHISIFKDENRKRTYGEQRIGIADEFMYLVDIDPDRRYSTDSIEDESCFYCEKEGTVVICDNPSCKRVFHPSCAGVKLVPEGEWRCPVCITDQVLSNHWPNIKYSKDLLDLLRKKQREYIESYNLRLSTGVHSPKRSEIARPRRNHQFLTKGTSEDKQKPKPSSSSGSTKPKKTSPTTTTTTTTTTTSSTSPSTSSNSYSLPPLSPLDNKVTMVSPQALDSYLSVIDRNLESLQKLKESLAFRKKQNHRFITESEMSLLQNLTSASRQTPASTPSVQPTPSPTSTPVPAPTPTPVPAATALSASLYPYLGQQTNPYLQSYDITVLAQVPYDVITQGYLLQLRAMNQINQLNSSFMEELSRQLNGNPKPPFQ
eukprot:TRINITY_DN852_c0_g1_i2.p1 TRINITY_DN852_c0_g1~~TRINITY_DN852_c0_g1_i2.p1  ORF type:complete len:764 (+),score=133.49 TRINITY_DN852_c0_g1_i2:672-2963(+)